MSFISGRNVAFSDGANLDAFGRLRVSDPTALFNSQFQYSKAPNTWDEIVTGSSTATHLPNESTVRMDIGAASAGESVIRQSREYIRYQPGKSQQLYASFVMGPAATNTVTRVGLFDANNGIFFQRSGSALSLVRRTNVTGTPVDNGVAQASWNIDKFDGTGPSGVTLDSTKSQIFFADLEWLGVGRVRAGFVVDGRAFYAHEFLNTNVLDRVYMSTANLPVRYEIATTGVPSGLTWLRQICCTVNSEGGFSSDRAFQFAYAGPADISCGTSNTLVLGLRPRTTFLTYVNRGVIIPESVDVSSSGNAVWTFFYAPTFSGGAWANVDASNSIAEVNTTATITGGIPVASGFLPSGGGGTRASINRSISSRFPMVLGADGSTQYGAALVVAAFTGSVNARGCLGWSELR